MAVKLNNTSTDNVKYLAPAYSDIVIEAEGIPDNIVPLFNVKYVIVLYINNVLMTTLKAPLDSNNKALFRISSILQDYTETDKSGYDLDSINSRFKGSSMTYNNHSIHQIDKFARNRDNLKGVAIIGGYEYSQTVSGEIIFNQSIGSVINLLFFNSVAQHKDGYSSQDFSDYLLNADNKKFLSVFSAEQNIQLGQYHTMAFLNGGFYEDSYVTKVTYKTYDSNDTLIENISIDNTDNNGGALAGEIQGFYFEGEFDNTDSGLLYVGCGTAQLVQAGADLTNVSYYTVDARNGVIRISDLYRFNIVGADCKGYETIRLAFLNSLGAWDYYNFTKKSTRTTQINKSVMKQNYGYNPKGAQTFFGDLFNLSYYNQGTYDGGTRTYNVNAVETIEANTDFVNEEEAAILEELFLSPDVYMQTGDIFEPVVINETEYVKQTSANDMLKQYIITIEKGHNKRVQRLW